MLAIAARRASRSSAESSVVREAEWMVAVDAEEARRHVRAAGARGGTIVRLASGIEPEWLIELFPGRHRGEGDDFVWDPARERVERTSRR